MSGTESMSAKVMDALVSTGVITAEQARAASDQTMERLLLGGEFDLVTPDGDAFYDADEVIVSTLSTTLSRWLRRARSLPDMSSKKRSSKKAGRSPRQWSAEEKMRVVLEAARLSDEELARIGISPGTFRMSVGIENIEDLKEDLDQAAAILETLQEIAPDHLRVGWLQKELSR